MNLHFYSVFFILLLFYGCAHVVAPSGGKKDIDPPKIVSTSSFKKNEKHNVQFVFDEFILLNDWNKYFYISPPTSKPILKNISKKTLSTTIQDTLSESINYYICLNRCLKDLNEGNILDSLYYFISQPTNLNNDTLIGLITDSYNNKAIENAWVMLFRAEKHDSLIFKSIPDYISKSDKKGRFIFPNITSEDYKIVAITDLDFFYDETDLIAFHPFTVSTKTDSFVSLFAFDPIVEIDSLSILDTTFKNNTIIDDSLNYIAIMTDTLLKKDSLLKKPTLKNIEFGNLSIITTNKNPYVFILLNDKEIIKKYVFSGPPYILNNIPPGEYNLLAIHDFDYSGSWTTGSWEVKRLPELVVRYSAKITIRENWDLDLIWQID